MLTSQFRDFLLADSSIKSKDKAVSSRLHRASKVESFLATSLDLIVCDDMKTYSALLKVKSELDSPRTGNFCNALRKYYIFRNHKDFPHLKDFEQDHGLLSHT